ncbi:hypothetical protein TSAR_004038, partial [Trichomalopsis sarcophagae]
NSIARACPVYGNRASFEIQVRGSSSWRESSKRSAMLPSVVAAAAEMQQRQKQHDRKPAAADPCRLAEEPLLEMPNAEVDVLKSDMKTTLDIEYQMERAEGSKIYNTYSMGETRRFLISWKDKRIERKVSPMSASDLTAMKFEGFRCRQTPPRRSSVSAQVRFSIALGTTVYLSEVEIENR